MGGTLIDLVMPATKIPDEYTPPCFIDINGTHLLHYNKNTAVLTLNCDQINCKDVEAAMRKAQKTTEGLELHIHGIDTPVYFPKGTKIKYLHNGLDAIETLFKGIREFSYNYL